MGRIDAFVLFLLLVSASLSPTMPTSASGLSLGDRREPNNREADGPVRRGGDHLLHPDTSSLQVGVFSIFPLISFRGSIFIRGQHESETCRMIFYNNDASEATFTVRVGDCGMIRLRQVNPCEIWRIEKFSRLESVTRPSSWPPSTPSS